MGDHTAGHSFGQHECYSGAQCAGYSIVLYLKGDIAAGVPVFFSPSYLSGPVLLMIGWLLACNSTLPARFPVMSHHCLQSSA